MPNDIEHVREVNGETHMRLRLMPSTYKSPVYLDARGDWYRLVGRLFWLVRRA